ncbi:MAG: hypothetical protein JWN66_5010 [Sphingomonas bacterium]|uniref:hypothetical protein n=1 Tax=Sphingomonas bacterium TaxID=1895847 RepID=UPI00261686E9|nr:hypothetical protein [Sphingomonas bacterium]MDB5707894.1 hypothetical protein [Sphingomonas bacterium]
MADTLQTTDDRWTLSAIGVVAACLSAFGHEAFGHGGACLAAGGTVTLLTATHFSCEGGNILVDAAGPLMNLVLAVMALGILRGGAPRAPSTRWFLFLLGGINLCWFASEMVASPIVEHYDQAAIARQLGWPSVWRPVVLGLGLVLYFWTVRYARIVLRRDFAMGDRPTAVRRRFGVSHLAATIAFVIAGLCWAREPLSGALECFLTIGVAVAPLWFSLLPARSPAEPPIAPVARSVPWILCAVLFFAAFALLQGRGIGRLA